MVVVVHLSLIVCQLLCSAVDTVTSSSFLLHPSRRLLLFELFLCRRLVVIVVASTSDANTASNYVLDSNNSRLAVIYCIDYHR